ncbi:MAG TPA: hypothetical protein VK817_27070, partial [Trebonia sp.]|nr:hypothetical protein [Trebonia sp.]
MKPHGVTLRIIRGFGAGIWLIYLVIPMPAVFGHGHSALYSAGAVALLVAFSIIYLTLIVTWSGPPRRVEPRGSEFVFALLFAIAIAGCVIYGSGAVAAWIFVSVAAGWAIRNQRRALGALAAAIACYLIFGQTSHLDTENFLLNLLPLVLVGIAVIGFR